MNRRPVVSYRFMNVRTAHNSVKMRAKLRYGVKMTATRATSTSGLRRSCRRHSTTGTGGNSVRTSERVQRSTNSGAQTSKSKSLTRGMMKYTISVKTTATITSDNNAANNGTFYITSVGTFNGNIENPMQTITTTNSAAVNETVADDVAWCYTDWVPSPGQIISATCEYHMPVRFDTDELAIQIEDSNVAGGEPIVRLESD
jgi:hypothetical protein